MKHHITDFDIQALVDNQLDWEREKQVRDFIQINKNALKRYESLKKQKEMLLEWWSDKEHN